MVALSEVYSTGPRISNYNGFTSKFGLYSFGLYGDTFKFIPRVHEYLTITAYV